MAESSQELVDIDPDFEPLSRPRSCTWPLPRPEFNEPDSSSTSSPASSVKQEPGNGVDYISNQSLLEETEDVTVEKTIALCRDYLDNCCHPLTQQHQRLLQHQLSPQLPRQQQQVPPLSPPNGSNSVAVPFQKKSASSRRNAWGNMSYADLISKAIESSPEKRLTLSQIYDWMVQSVPYFKDKGDSNSSAGWKNSIRHNLSLHSRFMRVQNEGTGKSSWWMLNPEGSKSGKPPRRRAASMDNNSKFTKSRGRAAKKKVSLQGVMDEDASSPVSQYSSWLGGSPNSHSNDTFEEWTSFRGRADSDASTLSGRRSPFLPEPDDLSESGEAHLAYPGALGAKMVTPLPSLAEVAGSLGHRSPDNSMMEGLLNNLNLLSPKNQLQETPHGSPMMQSNPGYHNLYALPSPGPPQNPPPEYPKSLYSPTSVNNASLVPMRPLSDTKVRPAGMGRFMGHYNNPETVSHEPPLLCMETMVSHAGGGGRGGLRPLYSGQGRPGQVGSMANPAPTQAPHPHHHPHPHPHPHPLPRQYPTELHRPSNPVTVTMNGHDPQALGHADGSGGFSSSNTRTYTQLGQPPPLIHLGGTLSVHHGNRNGFLRPRTNQHPAHLSRPERLPSDLDGMPIECFDCDMETVLHDTFMDGDAVDFSFDPMSMHQGLA